MRGAQLCWHIAWQALLEGFEPRMILVDEINKAGDAVDCRSMHVMFDPFGVRVRYVLCNSEYLKEPCYHKMPLLDRFRKALSLGREPDTAIFLVVHQPHSVQSLEHARDAWGLDTEVSGYVNRPRVAFITNQLVNDFHVVLDACCQVRKRLNSGLP